MVVSKAPKKSKKASEKILTVRGKRKTSVATASIRAGKGVVRVNRLLLSTIPNESIRLIISEPVLLAGEAGKTVDINVSIRGGGTVGQAEAARIAVARALVGFTGNVELKKLYTSVDRNMLVEDFRRVEPKKYLGPKARARFQKSYR